MVRGLRLSILAPFALLAAAISLITYFLFIPENQPLHRLSPDDIRVLSDDMDMGSLIECSRRQVAYLKKQDPKKVIAFGTDYYDNRWLLLSLEEFLAKLEQHPRAEELDRFLRDNYLLYQAGGRKDRRGRHMLVTGYYEPTFEGSLTNSPPFLTPLYTPPKSLVTGKGNGGDRMDRTGRYDHDNRFVDYWSRAEIETTGVLAGNELVYLKDPFDAFLLHVQGSGKIRLTDNSIRSVRFAGSNGLGYNSIGKLLVDEKKMALEEVNIPAIRGYLIDNPEERQRILHHNPRFIFFDWGDAQGPRGSSGEILTPGRSIALDGATLPGQMGYLVSRMPTTGADGRIIGWKPLTRFVFPQDSGAAIKGAGRVDIFWGEGEYAEIAANHMKEQGKLYFFVKKGYSGE
jgi:membrane-bound lytic murein transglycosylase A